MKKFHIPKTKSQKSLFGVWSLLFRASRELGFTLIELIVVFTIFTILSGVGIASFVTYSRSQAVDNSFKEFKTTLFTARSRALSQVKDGTCGSSTLQLQGYEVVMCIVPGHSHPGNIACNNSSNSYELQIICANSDGTGQTAETVLEKKFIDPSITFDSSSTATYFFFSTITAAVSSDASSNPKAAIKGYSITKSVTISQTGVIQ